MKITMDEVFKKVCNHKEKYTEMALRAYSYLAFFPSNFIEI